MLTLTQYAHSIGKSRSMVHNYLLQGRIPGAKK